MSGDRNSYAGFLFNGGSFGLIPTHMSDTPKVEPAMTPDEWAEAIRNDDPDAWKDWPLHQPHRLAALALYGQPFGFTHEDVQALRSMVEPTRRVEIARCREIMEKIAALLPPEGA